MSRVLQWPPGWPRTVRVDRLQWFGGVWPEGKCPNRLYRQAVAASLRLEIEEAFRPDAWLDPFEDQRRW